MLGCGFVLKLALPHLSIYFPPLLVTLQLSQKLIPYKHPMNDNWSQSFWLPQGSRGSGFQMQSIYSIWWFLHDARFLVPLSCNGKAGILVGWQVIVRGGCTYIYLHSSTSVHHHAHCRKEESSFQIIDLNQCNFLQCPQWAFTSAGVYSWAPDGIWEAALQIYSLHTWILNPLITQSRSKG